MKRSNRSRRGLIAVAVTAALLCGGVAYAAFPDTGVETYTGCLNVNGTAGLVGKVAVGANPLRACVSNERLVHFGGGDITKVVAGTGLSGGGDNGAVTINLDAAHSLPQGCGSGQVAKSDGSNSWSCASDNDTTYSAGTGLDLSGTTFSVQSDAFTKTSQSCASGFVTGSDSSGSFTCASPSPTLPAVHAQGLFGQIGLASRETKSIGTLSVPIGNYLVQAVVSVANHDSDTQHFSCQLHGPGTTVVDTYGTDLAEDGTGAVAGAQNFTLVGVVHFAAAGALDVSCDGFNLVADGELTALTVQ